MVRYANATLLELLGYARHDVVGAHIERLFNVGTRIFYQTHWFPLLRLHGRADEVFLMVRTSSGADLGVLSYATRRDTGDIYDCVLVPVRERAKYEQELLLARRAAEQSNVELLRQKAEVERANEQLEAQAVELELQGEQLREQADRLEQMADAADDANRAKSSFLAMMSHELRTPLNAITGYLQILDLGIAGPITDAQREIIDRLDRSGRHLLNLINDVLDLSRIEAGRVDYQLSDADLADIVGSVTPMVEPQMASKNISFDVRVDPGFIIRADVDKVSQIILNLLGNAVKFTPDNGSVEMWADTEGRAVRLFVKDSGIGIPLEQQDKVFQAFVQVDARRTRTAQGSGLGLTISRDLARGMSGDLTLRSEVGKGSTFMLSLPAASPRHTPAAGTRAPADTPVRD